ncbi:MAG: hypothetical protein ACOYK9_03320 [Chlamydiia bacterium]
MFKSTILFLTTSLCSIGLSADIQVGNSFFSHPGLEANLQELPIEMAVGTAIELRYFLDEKTEALYMMASTDAVVSREMIEKHPMLMPYKVTNVEQNGQSLYVTLEVSKKNPEFMQPFVNQVLRVEYLEDKTALLLVMSSDEASEEVNQTLHEIKIS